MAIDPPPRTRPRPRAPVPFRRLRLAARAAFFTGLAAIAALSLATFDAPETPGGDKTQHVLAYFLVAAAGFIGFRRRIHLPLFIAVLAFGALIEAAQALFTDTRVGDPVDFLANFAGAVLGWLASLGLRAIVRRAPGLA